MQDLIPPKVRKPLYAVYASIGVILGAIQVGIAAAEAVQPVWLTVAFAVFAFLGGAFGFTATAHTDTNRRNDRPTPGIG